jgi:hypothetical protein
MQQDSGISRIATRRAAGTDPEWFLGVLPSFRSRPIGPAYYPEPGFNDILASYASRLGDSTFLFEAITDRLASS